MNSLLHPVSIKLAKIQLKGAFRHFAVFVICLVIGVSIITTVNLFSRLIQKTMITESKSLLGGDLEVVSRFGENAEVKGYLSQFGKVSHIKTTQGMLSFKGKQLLVSIKAIDDLYPLYGKFVLKNSKNPYQNLTQNSVVVDSSLLAQLNLKLGEKIKIGLADFIVIGEIDREPDRVVQTLNFGPRVMMNHLALEKTGLIQNLSLKRERYRIKLKDEYKKVDFKDELQSQLNTQFSDLFFNVRDDTNNNNRVGEFINKLTGFLNLLSLGIFLIAGIGIASSIRSYLSRTYQTVAILKIQGANQKIILQTYGLIIGILAIISAIVGILFSFILFYTAYPFIADLLPILKKKIEFDFISPLLALWYSLLIAYLFSIPSLISLHKMKTSQLFRQKIYHFDTLIDKTSLVWILGFTLVLVLSITLTSSNPLFMSISIALLILALLAFALLGNLCQFVVKHIKITNPKLLWLRLALSNISDNKSNIYIVVLAIGMSLSILLTLNLTEANFNNQIKQRLNNQIPDLFMIDIQPSQKQELEKLLSNSIVSSYDILPLVRGKITAIKGVPIENLTIPEEIEWALRRDRGISYSDVSPKNAKIVAGKWWDSNYQGKPLASVDQRLLDEMNLKIGDEISIQILNKTIIAQIASSRSVDYASFQINFFLMLSPNSIEKFPHNYISTVAFNKSANEKINTNNRAQIVSLINEKLPNVSIVQTSEVIDLIKEVINNIAIALKVMASISIFAGFLILISVLSASIQDKLYETAIFKALGTSWNHIMKVHLAQWLILCTITCVVAIFVGITGAYLVDLYFANNFREASFYISLSTLFNLSAFTYLIVLVIGYFGLRKIFQIKISSLLRND